VYFNYVTRTVTRGLLLFVSDYIW